MDDRDIDLTRPAEAALIAAARLGDEASFQSIVAAHRPAVEALAALLSDDENHVRAVVDETFTVARETMRRMLGPGIALRPYLLLLVRRLNEEVAETDVATDLSRERACTAVPFRDHDPDPRHAAVARQFSWLPEAWQALVWHLAVEGDDEADAAALLGISPLGVPALLSSALVTLRQSVLAKHRARTLPPTCLGHALRLSRSRSPITPRAVIRHTRQCEACHELLDDLGALERDLPRVLAHQLLGDVADEYVALRRSRSRRATCAAPY
jgi:DNA-directed RNA polymerase specialized sigma24 family protein